MNVDPGELRDYLTIYAATGQARDELNRLTSQLKPKFPTFAKVEDITATEAALAGGKADQRTYRLLMPVHPDHAVNVYDAIGWCGKTIYVQSVQVLGDYREWLRVIAIWTDGA